MSRNVFCDVKVSLMGSDVTTVLVLLENSLAVRGTSREESTVLVPVVREEKTT